MTLAEKQCGFCEFRTSDEAQLAEHLRIEHNWSAGRPQRGGSAWRIGLVSCAIATIFVIGPCGAFFLAFNGLPPFEVSDASGQQFELRRDVPGSVRYRTGWVVSVAAAEARSLPDGRRVWVIPVTFENGVDDRGTVGVGSCSLYVDGRYQDAHREPAEVRSLGDVDETRTLSLGERYPSRLAVTRPSSARVVQLKCVRHAYVEAVFDLSPFLTSP